jgi:acyl dehydratase
MTDAALPTETIAWRKLQAGDELPELEIAVTTSLIVAGAIASRDFMPVHHDRDFATSQGSPDIFMNILTDNGLCSRYLTDWAGPEAMLKNLSIRLGVPAFPGSTLTFTGSVTGTRDADGVGIVDVAFRGANDLGDHVSGTAVLAFPDDGADA